MPSLCSKDLSKCWLGRKKLCWKPHDEWNDQLSYGFLSWRRILFNAYINSSNSAIIYLRPSYLDLSTPLNSACKYYQLILITPKSCLANRSKKYSILVRHINLNTFEKLRLFRIKLNRTVPEYQFILCEVKVYFCTWMNVIRFVTYRL